MTGIYLPLCALIAVTITPSHAGYSFTSVADTTGVFSYIINVPSLNSAGVVAFRAFLNDGSMGVYAGNGTAVTTIAVTTLPFGGFGDPAINTAGTVAFTFNPGGNEKQKILVGNGGPLMTIVDGNGEFIHPSASSINTAGTVSFSASRNPPPGGIFTITSGGVATRIGGGGYSAINDSGTVAYNRSLFPGEAIVTGNGGSLTTITDSSGPLKVFGYQPAINNSGTVAFVAGVGDRDSEAYGIYSGNGGALTTIADLSGPFNYFDLYGTQPSINGAGIVAFAAGLDAGGFGIFTGDGVTTNEIIGTGDSLFGSTVTSASISTTAFNDSGQLVFYYQLADGTKGIALATPTPEPSISLLLVSGAMLALRRRRSGHPRLAV